MTVRNEAEVERMLGAIRLAPNRARSPGRILADADELERDGHLVEARRDRREAAAVLWQHLRHTDQRPPGVSRQQVRRWIASVCA